MHLHTPGAIARRAAHAAHKRRAAIERGYCAATLTTPAIAVLNLLPLLCLKKLGHAGPHAAHGVHWGEEGRP